MSITVREARIGGIVYLVTIACGLFAEAYVRRGIRIAADPATTMANLIDRESLFRIGVGADLVMLGCYIVVTVILYRLFRETQAAASAIAAGFSLIGIAVLASATLFLLAALMLVPGNGAPVFPDMQGAALADIALRVQGRGYGVSLVFFGVYCCMIGGMIVRSRLIPAAVGWLMVLAGVAFLVNNVAGIVAPSFEHQIPPITMLTSLLGEGALGLWLAIFGIRGSAGTSSPRA